MAWRTRCARPQAGEFVQNFGPIPAFQSYHELMPVHLIR